MKKIVFILVGIFVIAFASDARAMEPIEAKEKAKEYAESIIKQCRAEAYKDNPISTVETGNAIEKNSDCLEAKVLELNKQILPENEFRDNVKRIEIIGSPYGLYYSTLYNSNKYCQNNTCGTEFHTIGSSYHSSLMEKILEDTAFVGYFYDLIK